MQPVSVPTWVVLDQHHKGDRCQLHGCNGVGVTYARVHACLWVVMCSPHAKQLQGRRRGAEGDAVDGGDS